MNKRFNGLALIFIIITIVITGCGKTSQPAGTNANTSENKTSTKTKDQPLQELTVATVNSTALYGPLYLAQEKDIWKQYGLKVKLISLDASASAAALISGDVQIVAGGPSIIDAALKTDKVKVIGTQGKIAFALYAKNTFKVEDLKGKTLGVTTAGGSVDTVARTLIQTNGLRVGKDVNLLYTGSNQASLASVSEGKIDACLISPPTTIQAEILGLKKISNLTEMKGILGLYGIMGVNQPFAVKNPAAIEAFMNAFAYAIKQTKVDKESTKAALGKYTKTDDDNVLEVSYTGYKDYWFNDLHIPETEVQVIIDEIAEKNPEAKSRKAKDLLDNRYADAVK